MTRDTSGLALPEPSAFYDPPTSSWRMSGGMFPSDSMPCLATLPTWGMTRRGALYELPMPALPTTASASSSLLPTPAAQEPGYTGPLVDKNGQPVTHVMQRCFDPVTGRLVQTGLVQAVPLLPTPVVNDMGAGKTVEAWDEWTERLKLSHSNGNGHGPSLSIEALRLLPTPVADNSRGLPQPGTDYSSLPNVVTSLLPTPGVAGGGKKVPEDATWSGKAAYKPNGQKVQVHIDRISDLLSHGATTPPPSPGGKPSPDEQHPDLLSLLDQESA